MIDPKQKLADAAHTVTDALVGSEDGSGSASGPGTPGYVDNTTDDTVGETAGNTAGETGGNTAGGTGDYTESDDIQPDPDRANDGPNPEPAD